MYDSIQNKMIEMNFVTNISYMYQIKSILYFYSSILFEDNKTNVDIFERELEQI